MKNYRYLFTIVSIIGLWFGSSVIWADDTDNNVSEEEVVVTASRTAEPESQAPGKTEVITKEEIQSSGAATVSEVLASKGVTISSYGSKSGSATVRLDGSNSYQTLVLVNGVPATAGPNGSSDLSYFPVAAIERIEICHGPLSALYGSSAVGGVVNIITDLTGEPMNEIDQGHGSFNTHSMDVIARQKDWGLAIGGMTTDGYRDYSDAKSNYFMGQYNFFQKGDEYLKLYWQHLYKDAHSPGSTTFIDYAGEKDQNLAVNLNGVSKIFNGDWEYKIHGQQYDLRYSDGSGEYEHQVSTYGVDAAGQYQLGIHQLITGFALKQEEFDSTTFGEHSRTNGGLFLQDSWPLGNRFKLVTALRQDEYTGFASPLLPKVTLVSSITSELTVKAGYGKAFRAPSFEDLYWNQPSWGMYGNPDLKPEKGDRADLIAEWKRNRQSITVDVYQSNLRDGIAWENAGGNTYTVSNIDKMRIQGINLNWSNTWADIVTTSIGYNWIDKEGYNSATVEYDDDLNTFGKQHLNLGLNFKLQNWQYGMDWYLIQDRSDGMPDYDVLNLNLIYQINRNLSVKASVDNFNNQYYEINDGYPMPGRNYTLSTKYTF